jgi:hypothetical protein
MLINTIIIATDEIIKRLKAYYDDSNQARIDYVSVSELFANDDEGFLYDINNLDKIYNKICQKLDSYDPKILKKTRVIFLIQISSPYDKHDNWNSILIYPKERNKPHPRSGLIGRLMLSYPEIEWIFLPETNHINVLNSFHYLKTAFPGKIDIWDSTESNNNNLSQNNPSSPGYIENIITLFDPSGWRYKNKEIIKIFNNRQKLSAAIDEEEEYAYLNGYIAYKLGYRCFVVTSMRLFEKLFSDKQEDQNTSWPLNIELTFEDMFLNFPDKETDEPHLSNLREKDSNFKKLKEVKNRIFVTVGHKYIKWSEANKLYLKELKAKARAKGGIVRKIYKPSGGIYNTMEQAGLLKDYWKKRKDEWQKAKPGPNMEEAGGHSAPGRLLLIADKLIERARKILDEVNTVQDCIHGALLALEAQELLGYKTPTTCLEAIALKHQLEVKAECMFYGVGYNIDMKNRFKEIEGEVKAVSEWFHPSVRKKSYLNAQLGIITELVEILRDYGQFDEELQCLKKIRKLNRQFYFLNHPGLKFVQPLRAYIDTLVGSFPLFCGALFFWPIFYGLLGYLFNTRYEGYKDGILTFWEQVANSSYTFFGLQPSSQPIDTISHVLTIFTVLTGFLHLGIFISYLYNLIFRK